MRETNLTCLDMYSELKDLWRIVTLDTASLFRHLTEVNGKEARGGYLEGSLWFSKELCSLPFVIKMTLISSDNLRNSNLDPFIGQMRIHPNLLYITRFDMGCMKAGKPKRLREMEPKNPLWRIELKVSDGRVEWLTESMAQPAGYYQDICSLKPAEDGFILDLKDLHITVITPLQRTNVNGIKIRDSIRFRRNMFPEIEEDRWEKIAKEIERFYTKADGKPELDRICLRFDLHAMDEDRELPAIQSQTKISEQIINTKSKHLGAFDLTGEISKQKTCTRVPRKVHIFSKFQLPNTSSPEQEIQPRFVLKKSGTSEYICDSRTYPLYSQLNQPDVSQTKVEKFWISFTTPTQSDDVIRQLREDMIDIYIEGYRLKDKDSTDTKILFQYTDHSEQYLCLFCVDHPDNLGSGDQEFPVDHEKARPGVKRRMKTQGRKTRFASSSSAGSVVSIASSPNAVEEDDHQNAEPLLPNKLMRATANNGTVVAVATTDYVDGRVECADSRTDVSSPEDLALPEEVLNVTANMPDLGPSVLDDLEGAIDLHRSPGDQVFNVNQIRTDSGASSKQVFTTPLKRRIQVCTGLEESPISTPGGQVHYVNQVMTDSRIFSNQEITITLESGTMRSQVYPASEEESPISSPPPEETSTPAGSNEPQFALLRNFLGGIAVSFVVFFLLKTENISFINDMFNTILGWFV